MRSDKPSMVNRNTATEAHRTEYHVNNSSEQGGAPVLNHTQATASYKEKGNVRCIKST